MDDNTVFSLYQLLHEDKKWDVVRHLYDFYATDCGDVQSETFKTFKIMLSVFLTDYITYLPVHESINWFDNECFYELVRHLVEFQLKCLDISCFLVTDEDGFSTLRNLIRSISSLVSGISQHSLSVIAEIKESFYNIELPSNFTLKKIVHESYLKFEGMSDRGPQTDLTRGFMGSLHSPCYLTSKGLEDEFSTPQAWYHNKRIHFIRSLGTTNVLLDFCLTLPLIKQAAAKVDGLRHNHFQSSVEIECSNHTLILSEIMLVGECLDSIIFIHEPLNCDKIEKLSTIILASLELAVVYIVVENNTMESLRNIANGITNAALTNMQLVMGLFRESIRADGHVVHNFALLCTWSLLRGMKIQFGSNLKICDTTKSLISGITLFLRILLRDLALEMPLVGETTENLEVAKLYTISLEQSSLQRMMFLFDSFPLVSLLLSIASFTMENYHRDGSDTDITMKSASMDRQYKWKNSIKYFFDEGISDQDVESGSDDEEAEDSDSLLGRWFKETLFPVDERLPKKTTISSSYTTTVCEDKNVSNMSATTEESWHVVINLEILSFLNKFIVLNENDFVRKQLCASINQPHQIALLASMVNTVDCIEQSSESSKLSEKKEEDQSSTIQPNSITNKAKLSIRDSLENSNVSIPHESEMFSELSSLLHNLIAYNILTDEMQNLLLFEMGLSPFQPLIDERIWRLQIWPRSLSILTHVVLLRHSDSVRSNSDNKDVCVTIWENTLSVLMDRLIDRESPESFCVYFKNCDWLNVEHAQMLLFLFHSLHLMEKKQLLLLTANYIMQLSDRLLRENVRSNGFIAAAHIMLLFEYMMRHLYEPPDTLLPQITNNLFTSAESFSRNLRSPLHCPFDDFNMTSTEQSCNPGFRYNLFIEPKSGSNEVPKLDGLALSFILSATPLYNQIHGALLKCLNVLDSEKSNDSSCLYCFTIAWRLLQRLPPSNEFLERISDMAFGNQGWVQLSLDKEPYWLLYTLFERWRLYNGSIFATWIKESSVKQGLTSVEADSLISQAAFNCQMAFMSGKIFEILLPRFEHCHECRLIYFILLDLLLTEFHASLAIEYSRNGDTSSPNVFQQNEDNGPILQFIDTHGSLSEIESVVPIILRLTRSLSSYARNLIVNEAGIQNNTYLMAALSVSGNITSKMYNASYSSDIEKALNDWKVHCNIQTYNDIPHWRKTPVIISGSYNDMRCLEGYMSCIMMIHLGSNDGDNLVEICSYRLKRVLKHALQRTLPSLIYDWLVWIAKKSSDDQSRLLFSQDITDSMLNIMMDIVSEDQTIFDTGALKAVWPGGTVSSNEDMFEDRLNYQILDSLYGLLLMKADSSILAGVVNFLTRLIEMSPQTLDRYFNSKALHNLSIFDVLFSLSHNRIVEKLDGPFELFSAVLNFFNTVFDICRCKENDASSVVNKMCFSYLVNFESESIKRLGDCLHYCLLDVFGFMHNGEAKSDIILKTRQFLDLFTSYIIDLKKEKNLLSFSSVSAIIGLLQALINTTSRLLCLDEKMGVGFSSLMNNMVLLADCAKSAGHLLLFPACCIWLHKIRIFKGKEKNEPEFLVDPKQALDDFNFECLGPLFKYMCNVIVNLKMDLDPIVGSNVDETSTEWTDEGEFDLPEIAGSEDEDSKFSDGSNSNVVINSTSNIKLCTFTQTKKTFMSQHWYHCHTCGMVDGVGVCSVCVQICHVGHDTTYSKFGSFFCDCGAKGEKICQALSKSSSRPAFINTKRTFVAATNDVRRRSRAPVAKDRSNSVFKVVEISKTFKMNQCESQSMLNCIETNQVIPTLIDIVRYLIPVVGRLGLIRSNKYKVRTIQESAKLLAQEFKTIHMKHNMMISIANSPEASLENIRMNFAGDQGHTIRQLISSHAVRRVVLCCVRATANNILVLLNEKGKISFYRLCSLLTQIKVSQKKVTFHRLFSFPVSFTVLSMSSNPANESFVAVSGLRDCHIMMLADVSPTSVVINIANHLVLHPQLEAANYIIKSLWLPGSASLLALVTADFVKIFDLCVDCSIPQYYFLVPTGKIVDCTLAYMTDGVTYVLIMSSAGHIYFQSIVPQTSASNGPFYVTNIVEICLDDESKNEAADTICGGGASIYFSHTLCCLFSSYSNGDSFMSSLSDGERGTIPECLKSVFRVMPRKYSSPVSTAPVETFPQIRPQKLPSVTTTLTEPLVHWSECPGHPGLVTAFLQSSNVPVVLMVHPNSILFQDIKTNSKSKVADMITVRYAESPRCEPQTSAIVLTEDGSLKLFDANKEETCFWLDLSFHVPNFALGGNRSKPDPTTNSESIISSNDVPVQKVGLFPANFFENCSQALLSETNFEGSDVAAMYNLQQIRHRLKTDGLYIANTKMAGFKLEISLTSSATNVIVGIRVLLGSQDLMRIPSYICIQGRTLDIPNSMRAQRWFEFPLNREESLKSDSKIVVIFGPSRDPGGVNIVDNVEVWCQLKDGSDLAVTDKREINPFTDKSPSFHPSPYNSDAFMFCFLNILEAFRSLYDRMNYPYDDLNTVMMELITSILKTPMSIKIARLARSVLWNCLPASRDIYHSYKDNITLSAIVETINESLAGIDAHDFQLLLIRSRAVAAAYRYKNLINFAASKLHMVSNGTASSFLQQIHSWFWQLLSAIPVNSCLGFCVNHSSCLTRTNATVHALVDVTHFLSAANCELVHLAVKLYFDLLTAGNKSVNFAAKSALMTILRPRPIKRTSLRASTSFRSQQLSTDRNDQQPGDTNEEDDILIEHLNVGPGGVALGGVAGNFDALLPGREMNMLTPLLNIPGDLDDDATMELAIALSLQEQAADAVAVGGGGRASGNRRSDIAVIQRFLQRFREYGIGELASVPTGNSDIDEVRVDEDEVVIVDNGETDDINDVHVDANVTDASASDEDDDDDDDYEDDEDDQDDGLNEDYDEDVEDENNLMIIDDENISVGTRRLLDSASHDEPNSDSGSSVEHSPSISSDTGILPYSKIKQQQNSSIHVSLLNEFVQYIPRLHLLPGEKSIPFMQIILVLVSNLECSVQRDIDAFQKLIVTLVEYLKMTELLISRDLFDTEKRSSKLEVKLLIMRIFVVLMSRSRLWTSSQPQLSISSIKTTTSSGNNLFVARIVANTLFKSGVIQYCYHLLCLLLQHWKSTEAQSSSSSKTTLLLPSFTLDSPLPDMSPFFSRSYVKIHALDIFQQYPSFLTEVALRITYQVSRIVSVAKGVEHQTVSDLFDDIKSWHYILSEYIFTNKASFVRRKVRKLFIFLCGNKEAYREVRNMHSLAKHMHDVHEMVDKCVSVDESFFSIETNPTKHKLLSLDYNTLLDLIQHLQACLEVSTSNIEHWQNFCLQDAEVLRFLYNISFHVNDGVNSYVLRLLQAGLDEGVHARRSDRSASDVELSDSQVSPNDAPISLCNQMIAKVHEILASDNLFERFVCTFLLDNNSTSIRWNAHSLITILFKNSTLSQRITMTDIFWNLWPFVPQYGRKAAQFVDVLGFFCVSLSNRDEQNDVSIISPYLERALSVLSEQNYVLSNHPNATIYECVSRYVDFKSFYLECDPCLVCNHPELPYTQLKLSTLKADTKYTTTTQMVKLSGCHSITKIGLRICDLKRQNMVRSINIFYNNRSVTSVVELKSKNVIWQKAKWVPLLAGQTDIKIDFPLPIVACNVMVEYADFYENGQASSETLQCPRCSASVPANPGICSNCGENAFQCHKCRSINYDQKDPFLCNACGFCKYAKFEYTLTMKPCCDVEPITNQDERAKAVEDVNTLLEKTELAYRKLRENKIVLENLMARLASTDLRVNPVDEDRRHREHPVPVSTTNHVNRLIQNLAEFYGEDCCGTFEELSKIIQRVLSFRQNLVTFEGGSGRTTRTLTNQVDKSQNRHINRCYGCASASVEHCLTLLKALSSSRSLRKKLCQLGLVEVLLNYNLRHGVLKQRSLTARLICRLTRDDRQATNHLSGLLDNRICRALRYCKSAAATVVSSVVPEISLLTMATVHQNDACWEQWLRCVFGIFLKATQLNYAVSAVTEVVVVPCLNILLKMLTPTSNNKIADNTSSVSKFHRLSVDLDNWLHQNPFYSFWRWDKAMTSSHLQTETSGVRVTNQRRLYLMQKCFCHWRHLMSKRQHLPFHSWLKSILFSPTSRQGRKLTGEILSFICHSADNDRTRLLIDILTTYLDQVVNLAGETVGDFFLLFEKLIKTEHWKLYLVIRHRILSKLAELISNEIGILNQLEADATSGASANLTQGYVLKWLTNLLSLLLADTRIKSAYKGRLVSTVLQGYLSLKRLISQRTKRVDVTQKILLEILEDITTGTEEETRDFMVVCINTINSYPLEDYVTPVFIFERLCNLIYPEETEDERGEFFMLLEKDPLQEDFLHGRMLGNPYSSKEKEMGQLMRDIKNKICRDCDLVALLEDDNGMELLVCNKIISLDLPVKEVYAKVWLARQGTTSTTSAPDPMRIIYRMRGLLGDATEEFIETLNDKNSEDRDDEEVYRRADVMAHCGGLEIILGRFESVQNLTCSSQFLTVLLKLFDYCIKIKCNREKLLDQNFRCIPILLRVLKLCLSGHSTNSNSLRSVEGGASNSVTSATNIPSSSTIQAISPSEVLLLSMEKLLVTASEMFARKIDRYCLFASNGVIKADIENLLMHAVHLKSGTLLHQRLMRVLPFLTYGNDEKMKLIIDHFGDVLDFPSDVDGNNQCVDLDKDEKMEAFASMCEGIQNNNIGDTMKQHMLKHGVVNRCIQHIKFRYENLPADAEIIIRRPDHEQPEWKELISRSSLPFMLKALTGLATKHAPTQMAVAEHCIPILHRMEQISSDEHVGTLAEELLEALSGNEDVAKHVLKVRQETKAEKKKLAMAMRAKQLKAFGLKADEQGLVKAEHALLRQFFMSLTEESGLSCNICREGYKFQPTKVLAIYTYTTRRPLDELLQYQTSVVLTVADGVAPIIAYSTVSHFNLVHTECHLAAVRQARSRNEWDSAMLQNANTKCNGLLPLWGPGVPEASYAAALAQHQDYQIEATGGLRTSAWPNTVHELQLLLLHFAADRSFSHDSGGGGPASNMNLVPYVLHTMLYVANTTRALAREENDLCSFYAQENESQWLESCYKQSSGGPIYSSVICLMLIPPSKWKRSIRLHMLKRLLLTAHLRCISPNQCSPLSDRIVKNYSAYKLYIRFFALIDLLYANLLSCVGQQDIYDDESSTSLDCAINWSNNFANWIRNNDDSIAKIMTKILATFQDDILTAVSLEEIIDVCGEIEWISSSDSDSNSCNLMNLLLQDMFSRIP